MIGVLWDVLHSKTLTKTYITKKSAELQNQPVPDLDLKIAGGGIQTLKKGGAPVSKRVFSAHQASGCPKKRGAPPRAPPLDPPRLTMI